LNLKISLRLGGSIAMLSSILCLNHIKHSRIKDEYLRKMNPPDDRINDRYESLDELMQKIEDSIAMLPPKRREIFRLSRQEGLQYKAIASRLNISIKTVETQIGLAI